MNMIEGSPSGEGRRFGLVVARFNHFVTEPLLEGAVAGLKEHGVRDEDLTVVRVPGTFELPPVALRMARSGRFDAIIAIGAVIRGGTPHFDYVAAEAAKGTAERAGEGASNKGWEAAAAALEMADLNARLGAAGL